MNSLKPIPNFVYTTKAALEVQKLVIIKSEQLTRTFEVLVFPAVNKNTRVDSAEVQSEMTGQYMYFSILEK